MNHFQYINNALHAEDVAIEDMAKTVGTPFYCYASATIKRHFEVLQQAFLPLQPLICYAVKANSNIAVIKTLAALGAGADIVTYGEMMRALKAGIAPEKIVFSGVGKSREELTFAINRRVGQINIESAEEFHMIKDLCHEQQQSVNIAFRVNPDIDAGTHHKITTGKRNNKFGISFETARRLIMSLGDDPYIKFKGIAVHIGSQLTDLQPYEAAFQKLNLFLQELQQQGIIFTTLDLGGGLGVPYKHDDQPPLPLEYAKLIKRIFNEFKGQIILEPGRVLVGNSGILVTKIIRIKKTEDKTFIIVDAAMNDLIRPSMYEAYHEIEPVRMVGEPDSFVFQDVVGPVCESSDIFAANRLLPELAVGDLLAIKTAGAYGAVMSSMYNTRPLIAEVLVHGQEYHIIRKRVGAEEQIALESLPGWFK